MQTVTKRIKTINQPRGGYLPISMFNIIEMSSKSKLNEKENVQPNLIGLAVDYLTRYMLGTNINKAFEISIKGAINIREDEYAERLLENIKGLDDTSIIAAIKLTGYDVCFRVGRIAYSPIEEINPDEDTIKNVKIMVERSLDFFDKYGPVVLDGFTFKGGYTSLIGNGDGDFLTKDTLWDFKVSVKKPTKDHTLQILVYYLMGKHSVHKEFESIKNIAIYNPRLNTIYTLSIENIDSSLITQVEKEVIGY